MLIMCDSMKKSTFKERPEDLLWYRMYRDEKLIIFKKKGERDGVQPIKKITTNSKFRN